MSLPVHLLKVPKGHFPLPVDEFLCWVLAVGALPDHLFRFFSGVINRHGTIGAYGYSARPAVYSPFQDECLGSPGDT